MDYRAQPISTDNEAGLWICNGYPVDMMKNTGRYPAKLGNGILLSVKEENMTREGTMGAEGKSKGNERKKPEIERRRQFSANLRHLKKTPSAKARWDKNKATPYPKQAHEDTK